MNNLCKWLLLDVHLHISCHELTSSMLQILYMYILYLHILSEQLPLHMFMLILPNGPNDRCFHVITQCVRFLYIDVEISYHNTIS